MVLILVIDCALYSLLETFLLKKRKNYAKDYLTVTYLLSGFNKLGENKEKVSVLVFMLRKGFYLPIKCICSLNEFS